MRYAGIDIGSRTIKLAVLENGELVFSRTSVTSHNPLETAQDHMDGAAFDAITATGYGRHLRASRVSGDQRDNGFYLGCPLFPDQLRVNS